MTARKPKNGDRVSVKVDADKADWTSHSLANQAFDELGAGTGGHFEDVALASAKDGVLTYAATFVGVDEDEAVAAEVAPTTGAQTAPKN